MAPVVDELKALPDADIRAMATYLAGFNDPLPAGEAEARAQAAAAGAPVPVGFTAAARLYDGACATCHEAGRGAVLAGAGHALGLHTSLHAERPDTFLRAVLAGIDRPARGVMPGFAATLDDRQIAELAAYVRARFAPARPPWQDLAETAAQLRAAAR
jgi:nicotinate dehydrogenase subunit B